MAKCKKCGKKISYLTSYEIYNKETDEEDRYCQKCADTVIKEKDEQEKQKLKKEKLEVTPRVEAEDMGEKRIDLLEGIASVNLVISLLVGFIMMVMGFASGLYLFLGLVLILEGIIVYALLNVIASMGTNLIAIRKNTEKK